MFPKSTYLQYSTGQVQVRLELLLLLLLLLSVITAIVAVVVFDIVALVVLVIVTFAPLSIHSLFPSPVQFN